MQNLTTHAAVAVLEGRGLNHKIPEVSIKTVWGTLALHRDFLLYCYTNTALLHGRIYIYNMGKYNVQEL